MPALAREQGNTPSILNWFITVNGTLTDAFEVGFQIWDISGGLPGTQIFPAIPDTWETVSGNDGNFSVGSYYAFDVVEDAGWMPGVAEPIGTHRIKWRWKITAAAPYQSDAEDFEVLVQSAGGTADTYITVQDIRNEGLSETDYSDEKVLSYIETWQAFLERACRQWFVPKSMILEVDGNDSDTLFLGVPIISVDYLKINGQVDELNEVLYRVYSGRDANQDHRRNPKICLTRSMEWVSIYDAPLVYGEPKFRKGRKNQEVKGIFGFVEDDSGPPKMIKRALTLLVVEKLTLPIYSSGVSAPPPPIITSVIEEETDGHRIKYGAITDSIKSRKAGLSGITASQEVLDIIKLYRAPFGVATPAHWSFQ
jgi:hypothetical protein